MPKYFRFAKNKRKKSSKRFYSRKQTGYLPASVKLQKFIFRCSFDTFAGVKYKYVVIQGYVGQTMAKTRRALRKLVVKALIEKGMLRQFNVFSYWQLEKVNPRLDYMGIVKPGTDIKKILAARNEDPKNTYETQVLPEKVPTPPYICSKRKMRMLSFIPEPRPMVFTKREPTIAI